MTKEECEKALNEIEELYYNSDNSFGAMKQFKKDIEVLNILINDHFENYPLRFEELKEGMWVWDDVEKEFIRIESTETAEKDHPLYIEGTEIIICKMYCIEYGTFCIEFEPNRFYRKKVEE